MLSAACAPALRAQEQLLDEGTLLVTKDGLTLGRESFRIVRAAGTAGQVYRATGQLSMGDRRVTTSLGVDSLGSPVLYDAEVRVNGTLDTHLHGTGRPERFSTIMRTRHGESARDYVLQANALVLDREMFHQYYFVALPPDRPSFSVVEPLSGTQATFRFEARGQESIRVGRTTVQARHVSLVGSDGATRDVWVAQDGRLLRVSIPAAGLIAQRDDLGR